MRKRREVNDATRVSSAADQPATNEQQKEESDFFQQLQQIPVEGWQTGFKVYVYRVLPVIDKKDNEHFLCKVTEPFDEDYLMRNFGSGKYYLRLNNQRGETIASKTVALHNPAFPPKVSPDEVVRTDPRNETYFKVWAPKEQAAATAPPSSSAADSTAVQELSKLLNKALEQRERGSAADSAQSNLTSSLVQWALDQTGKERENNDPTKMAALLRELKSLLPSQQPPDGLALIEKVLAITEKLNPASREAQQDPLDYVEKAVNLVEKLRPQPVASGASGDSQMGSWQEFFQPVLPSLISALAPIVPAMAQMLLAKNARQQQGPPVSPVVSPVPAPAGAPPAGGEPAPQHQPAAPASGQDFAEMAANMAPLVLNALAQPGRTGADLADSVVMLFGPLRYQQIAALGKETLLAFLQSHPLWQQLGPVQARVPEFIEEFIAYQEPEDDEPANEDEPEETAAAR
jgi:hypothetical protein